MGWFGTVEAKASPPQKPARIRNRVDRRGGRWGDGLPMPCLACRLMEPESASLFLLTHTVKQKPCEGLRTRRVLGRCRVLFETTPRPISRNHRFYRLFNGLDLACIQPGQADFESSFLRIEDDFPHLSAAPLNRDWHWHGGVV